MYLSDVKEEIKDGNQKSKHEELFRSTGNQRRKLSQKHGSYKQQNDATSVWKAISLKSF